MNAVKSMAMVVALLCMASPASQAETPRKKARMLFRQGTEHYARGEYSAALERFRQAKALYPSYKIDLNIGATLEAMGNTLEAADHYKRFLQRGQDAEHGMLQEVKTKLEELGKKLSSVTVDCMVSGAIVTMDGKMVGETPLDSPIYVEPGHHELKVTRAGHQDFTRTLELGRSDHQQVTVQWAVVNPAPFLTQSSDPMVPAEPRDRYADSPLYKKWWFWTVVGAVLVGATVGGVVASTAGGSDRLPAGEAGTIAFK